MVCCCGFYLSAFIVGAIACYVSSTVRYYMKFATYFLGSMILCLLPLPLFVLRPRDYRNASLPTWGGRWLLRALGVRYEVRGLENIQKNHGAVVVLNHQSGIDITVLGHLWPVIGRATAVAKKELLYVFPLGLAAYLWGTLFIDRSNKTDAKHKLHKEVQAIREGAKLLIFPEGTRQLSEAHTLLPFKKGAFHTAIQSESAIQPVVVSRYWFLDSKRKIFGRGHSIIQILPEIPCKGLGADDIPKLIETTHQLMQETYEKLNAETRPMHEKYE